jgi:hypothetical protein
MDYPTLRKSQDQGSRQGRQALQESRSFSDWSKTPQTVFMYDGLSATTAPTINHDASPKSPLM